MKKESGLGPFDLIMIVVSLVIGMGIFKTPSTVAANAGVPSVYFLAWILGGIIALCGALTYAEIGSRYPVTGGYYKIFSYCYHPALGFMINVIILVSNAASTAAVALIGSEYFTHSLLPLNYQTPAVHQYIAIGSLLFFFGINLLGLRLSSHTQNFLTIIKISLVSVLVLSLFVPAGHSALPAGPEPPSLGFFPYIRNLGVCLIAVSFTYGGYQQTMNFGGEVRHSRKVIPRSIFWGIAIILTLYLAINLAYFRVIGFQGLKSSQAIAGILAGRLFGSAGDRIFSVLLFFSVLAYVNVQLLSNPRVIYAMSKDGILPGIFQREYPRTRTFPAALLAFTSVCILALFLANRFEQILNYTIFLDSIGMASSAATLFILRRRTRSLNPQEIYQMRLYPLMPLVFIGAYSFVGLSIVFNFPMQALYGTLLFGGLFPLYLLFRYFHRFKNKPA